MKRTLLLVVLIASVVSAKAQCTPNPLYTDSVFGVWPDTISDFRPGMLEVFYSDTLNLLIPSSALDISTDYPDITIDSVQLVSVTGLPPGLAISCNSQTPASCSYSCNSTATYTQAPPTNSGSAKTTTHTITKK